LNVAYCPECEADIELEEVEKGEIVNCPIAGRIWKWWEPIPSSSNWPLKKKRIGESNPASGVSGFRPEFF
jgi:hypothetical protein